ncbi:MAG: ferritin-like domain-containing protein [Minicystis sp.]
MDFTSAFRRQLLVRLSTAAAVVVPVAAMAAACSSSVSSGGKGGAGGNGGNGGAPTTAVTNGSGGGGGQTATGWCKDWPAGGAPATPCPPYGEQTGVPCGKTLTGDATFVNGQCCYPYEQGPCVGSSGSGRPFLVGDEARVAAPRRVDGWTSNEMALPRVDDLPAAIRARLAEAWAQDGLLEHASVASFGRFALELLAAGAPARLVQEAYEAALDEVRHARLCLGLASAYAAETIAPAPFPFGGPVEVTADLASIAARAAREGCVGETIAALTAAEQLARATDPAVRAVLAVIVEDESRHAELAYRVVAWAIRAGGAPVRAAVAAVLAELACGREAPAGDDAPADATAAHGRLDAATMRATAARATAEVVRPCMAAMLVTEEAPVAVAS